MKGKRSMVLLLIVVCLCLCSCGEHKHKWTDNGCESYKVCKDCGEQGEYVEHYHCRVFAFNNIDVIYF